MSLDLQKEITDQRFQIAALQSRVAELTTRMEHGDSMADVRVAELARSVERLERHMEKVEDKLRRLNQSVLKIATTATALAGSVAAAMQMLGS